MPDDPDINPDEQPEEQKPEKPGNQQEEVAEFIAGVVDRRITAALQTTIPQMIQASIEGAIPKIVEGKLSKSLGPVVQPAPSVQTNGVVASPQVPEVVQATARAAVTGWVPQRGRSSRVADAPGTCHEPAGQCARHCAWVVKAVRSRRVRSAREIRATHRIRPRPGAPGRTGPKNTVAVGC